MTVGANPDNDPGHTLEAAHTEPERIVVIPADPATPIYETTIRLVYPHFYGPLAIQGTNCIERVAGDRLHDLVDPGHTARWPSVVMAVDESGVIKRLPVNIRAGRLYGGPAPICGDVYLCGEAAVFEGIDFTALPATVTVADIAAATSPGTRRT